MQTLPKMNFSLQYGNAPFITILTPGFVKQAETSRRNVIANTISNRNRIYGLVQCGMGLKIAKQDTYRYPYKDFPHFSSMNPHYRCSLWLVA